MRLKVSLILILSVFLSLFISIAQAKENTYIIPCLDKIEKFMKVNPQLAWHQLDSINRVEKARSYKSIPKHRIDFLFARIASTLNRNSQSVDFYLKAFESDSVQHDSKQYIRTAYLLCEELLIMQDNERAMKFILLALERSKKDNDIYNESVCLGILSKVYYFNDQMDNAYKTIEQAIEVLEKNKDNPNVYAIDKLAIFRSVQADYYAQNEKHEKALESAEKGLGVLESMSPSEIKASSLDSISYRYWLASFHSVIASQYQMLNQSALAKQHAEKAVELIKNYKILRIDVYYKILHYYTNANDYDNAIKLTRFLEANSTETDTINIFNQAYKEFLASAYEGKRDYPNAYKYLKQTLDITAALNYRARAQASMELATVYETAEKDAQIQAREFELKRKNFLIAFLVVGLLFLAAIIYIVLRNSRIVKIKNVGLYNQLKEQDKLTEELAFLKQKQKQEVAAATNTPKEASLFERIETFLLKTQRYTESSLSREALATELGTNQKYLCDAIQEAKGQTFNEYLNSLRLNHARVMLTKPNVDYTIETIALDSGFGSRNTFYRLFREKYRLTPLEFKQLAAEK